MGEDMIKLVVSDMDGTFLDDHKKISEANKLAVQRLGEMGTDFCICTGRVYSSALLIAKELDYRFPIIACNGAFVQDPITQEVLMSNALSTQKARDMIQILMRYDVTFHFYNEYKVYSNRFDRTAKRYIEQFEHLEEKPIEVIVSDSIIDYVEEARNVYKIIMFTSDSDKLKAIWDELSRQEGITITQSTHDNIEIVREGVSKGKAIEFLASRKSLRAEEIFVIGDQMNDRSMFSVAKYSVAMGNATDRLKEEAYYVTGTNNESGFAQAVEALVFRKER